MAAGSWQLADGRWQMVTSIVSLGDKKGYQIKYVDDPTQGDGTKANQEHTITVDKNGNITSGGGGRWKGSSSKRKRSEEER